MPQNGSQANSANQQALLLIIASIVSISPLILYVSPVKGNIVSLLSLGIMYLLVLRKSIGLLGFLLTATSVVTLYFLREIQYETGISSAIIAQLLLACLLIYLIGCRLLLDKLRIIKKNIYGTLEKIRFGKLQFWLCFIVLFLAILNSFYWTLPTFKILIYLITMLLLTSFVSDSSIMQFVKYSSKFHLIILYGGLLGFLYAIFGGDALFTILNEDGRQNGFYLSTFSNTYLNGFIRPSGIYDEPGALSFFVCLTVALRESYQLDRRCSWLLLALSFITVSLAHFIFVIMFFIHVYRGRLVRAAWILIIISFLLLAIITIIDNPLSMIIKEFANRLTIKDGMLVGNNRSALVINAINYMDFRVFFFGLDGNCIANNELCDQSQYEQYGENPLTLLVHLGIFISLPYYVVLSALVYNSIKNINFVVFGVFLLLLQRPYVLSYGYVVIIIIYLLVIFKGTSKVSSPRRRESSLIKHLDSRFLGNDGK